VSGTGAEGDDPPLDRTQAFRPEGAPAPKPAADLPRIPGITLHFEVARGGMGVVYSGRQDFLDRRVAVKLLSMDLAGEKFAQRFQREAKLLAGIKHPNIVACHSAGTTDDGQSYLVMEFVDGPSLKAWIAEQGALPTAAALRLTRSVALALAHAYQLDVIHRDVKPENILLEAVTSTAIDVAFPYVPKLVDLGLARMTSETAGLGLTSPGSVMGTPATMSPEQFDDPDSVDFRTDIYGLGCALYEMLVGAAAYRGNKLTEIVVRKRQPVGPNPCEEAAHVPAAVGALVCSMLAADRDDRPASYRELDERLDELLAALPADGPRARAVPRTAKGEVAATQARGPASAPPPKSGPGLLRTAEIDFLQAGMEGGGTATPAFRGGTVVAPAPTAVVPAAGSRRGVWIGVGVGALALVAVGAWFATRGSGEQDTRKPVVANAPPRAVQIEGDESVGLSQWITLVALAEDPDGDPLSYDWSTPDEVQRSDEKQNTIKVRLLEGLPDESFEVRVAVRDGHNEPVVATRQLRLAVEAFPTLPFLVSIKNDARWTFQPPDHRLTWTKLVDMDVVSCNARDTRQSATISMGHETFWRLTGKLLARPADESRYAAIAVRLELGNNGWSMICRRTGELGENWSIELVEERGLAGVWEPAVATGAPRRVEWVEAEDAADYPYAEVSLARRRDKVTLRWGQGEAFQDHEVTIPPGVDPHVTLWVEHGSGEFRNFTRW
jgi:serine/threonine-protein kinase